MSDGSCVDIVVDRRDPSVSTSTRRFSALLVVATKSLTVLGPASWSEDDFLRAATAELSKPGRLEALCDGAQDRQVVLLPSMGGLRSVDPVE